MRTLSLLLIIVSFLSCRKDPDKQKTTRIDSNIIVTVKEQLNSHSRELVLHCRTEKTYPCINFPLLASQNFKSSALEISFMGIGNTELCLTAIGPAAITIPLSTLKEGSYEIWLNNGEFKNKGHLEISNEKVDLLFSNPKGIIITSQSTQRIPPNTYWGTIGYHSQATAPAVEEFLQKVAEFGADFNKQTPGQYVFYEIDEHGSIVTKSENSGYHFMKAFVFQYDGDEELFKKNIKELGATYFDEMYINMETYKGERVNNWEQ